MIRGKVGAVEVSFAASPRGESGVTEVTVRVGDQAPQAMPVRWRRDAQGLWLETPTGVYGFDLIPERDPETGEVSSVRTVSAVSRTKQSSGAIVSTGVRFIRSGEETALLGGAAVRKRSLKVRAQMPGKIVRVHVAVGDVVKKGQSLLTMEAMKMENEIRALQDGVVKSAGVVVGQAVESGAELLVIE